MKASAITEKKSIESSNFDARMEDDDDAAYRPILRGIINTRCNYDGSKIDGLVD